MVLMVLVAKSSRPEAIAVGPPGFDFQRLVHRFEAVGATAHGCSAFRQALVRTAGCQLWQRCVAIAYSARPVFNQGHQAAPMLCKNNSTLRIWHEG